MNRTAGCAVLALAGLSFGYAGCSFRDEQARFRSKLMGEWRDAQNVNRLHFFHDGRFTASFHQSFPSRAKVASTPGVYMEIGYMVVEYDGAEVRPGLMRKRDGSSPTETKVHYRPRDSALRPSCNVMLRTDSTGATKVMDAYQGKPLGGFSVGRETSLGLFTVEEGEPALLHGLSFLFTHMDPKLNWWGDLSARGAYVVEAPNKIRMDVPVTGPGGPADLVLSEVVLTGDSLRLSGRSLGIADIDFTKEPPETGSK